MNHRFFRGLFSLWIRILARQEHPSVAEASARMAAKRGAAEAVPFQGPRSYWFTNFIRLTWVGIDTKNAFSAPGLWIVQTLKREKRAAKRWNASLAFHLSGPQRVFQDEEALLSPGFCPWTSGKACTCGGPVRPSRRDRCQTTAETPAPGRVQQRRRSRMWRSWHRSSHSNQYC